MKQLLFGITISLLLMSASCEKSQTAEPIVKNDDTTAVYTEHWVYDLAADSGSTGHYVYFDLKTKSEVTDSNSLLWHLGFRSTNIILNSGASGPGEISGQVVVGNFKDITEAPTNGYVTDSENGFAIPNGSGEGWYNYSFENHTILPIPGRIVIVRLSDSVHYKMEIISFYEGSPESPDYQSDKPRFYTFRYQQI